MKRVRGFGRVSPEEIAGAEDFFADLMGGTSRGASRGRARARGYGEAHPEYAPETTPLFSLTGSVGASPSPNAAADVAALKNRFIALGYNWIRPGNTIDTDTITTIKLFQSIIKGSNSVSGDGIVSVPGTATSTYRWLQATNAPRWQTMPAGSRAEGFYNYELADTSDHHDYGTDWMADTIRGAAAHYRDNWLRTHTTAALLTVNDVSLTRGGDTPDHAGHETGLACDLRLPKKDGTTGTTVSDTANYDRDATRAVLQALRAQPLTKTIYLNDDVLIREGLCTRKGGHHNHVHFHLKPPQIGPIATAAVPPTGLLPTPMGPWPIPFPFPFLF